MTNEDIIKLAHERNEFVVGDDGYYYYWPNRNFSGGYPAYALRLIADELDRLNKDWDDQIKKYFEEHKDKEK